MGGDDGSGESVRDLALSIYDAFRDVELNDKSLTAAEWRTEVGTSGEKELDRRLLRLIMEAEKSTTAFSKLVNEALENDFELENSRSAEFKRRWATLCLAAEPVRPLHDDKTPTASGGTLREAVVAVLHAGNACLSAPHPDIEGLQVLHERLASFDADLRDRTRYSLHSADRSRVAESVGRCLDAVAYLLAVVELNAPQDTEQPPIGAPQEADRTAARLMRAREMDYARARFRERFNQLAAQLDRLSATGRGWASEEG